MARANAAHGVAARGFRLQPKGPLALMAGFEISTPPHQGASHPQRQRHDPVWGSVHL